eukprot:TRINITY_DN13981_c0_g1_i1.p1 TRINITY_DN13981_c0_g1~~TRINITY_DN13981_c0_g1_i1.p1  ORF type:complete len:129 (+),score=17.54 TRINITY_DN13981_c0_g1_i1:100-486(+)
MPPYGTSTATLKGPPFHGIGLVACNAAGTLAVHDFELQYFFLSRFWNIDPPNDHYDAMLYMLSLLAVSGNYKFYGGEGVASPQADEALSELTINESFQLVVGLAGVVFISVSVSYIVYRNRYRVEEIV